MGFSACARSTAAEGIKHWAASGYSGLGSALTLTSMQAHKQLKNLGRSGKKLLSPAAFHLSVLSDLLPSFEIFQQNC